MKAVKKPYYTLEFKQDAAKLVIEQGYTTAEASKSLGVSLSALRRWVNSERKGCIKSNQGQSVATTKVSLNLSEHEELLRLRKENAKLKMEREILKKASAFFAQEMK